MSQLEMSPEIEKIAAALNEMQKIVLSASKDSKAHNYSYADLASCWAVVREPLTANGLSVTQWPQAEGRKVTVTTVLMHTSGQWMRSSLSLDAKDASCQAIGSAITYGRRYALGAACGIAPDDDDDGKSAMPDGKKSLSPSPQHYTPPLPPKQPEVFDPKNRAMTGKLLNWLGAKNQHYYEALSAAISGKEVTPELIQREFLRLQQEG